MKATISVFGRFHAFNLALQLQKRGYLHQLISSYPSFAIAKWEIDAELVRSLWQIETLSRLWAKTPSFLKRDLNLQFWFHENYDLAARKFISEESDVFIGWSSLCLHSLRTARSSGAITVVDRGSSHMTYQTQILEEEYEKWGLKFTSTHPSVYERELQEYEESDCIAIPSLFVKKTFIDQGISENKLIHVPYGTSLTEFYPVKKEDNIFRVIHCGGITFRKGIPYLLQAFYELRLPDAELWLVGTVNPEVEPFLKKYQSPQILLKGKQPQNQLRWFYSQCSVFCIASIEEGLAMVQLQAMACGLPVIHTTNTGGSDIVQDGVEGFCIPIRDAEAIKEKILFFYEDPDKTEEMGRNALEKAKTSLSWDNYGDKMIMAYQYALARLR